MSATDWAVIAAAAAAIALVNWYFLFARRGGATAAAVTAGGVQQATVRIEGGYVPAEIAVDAGRPVRVTFDRRENNPCSEELVLPAFGIRRELPAFQQTTIEFTPQTPGRYEFTCGMGMLHGAVIVR